MRTTRTFIAVAVPEPLGVKLTRLQTLLGAEVPDVRWSSVAPFHATLAFLGDVDDLDLNRVCQAVDGASRAFPRLALRLEGLGAFPDAANASTLWVGLTGADLPTFVTLREMIAAAVDAAGYPAVDGVFRPHVTIGRIRRGRQPSRDLSRQLNHFRTWSAGSCSIAEVITYASTLTRDGPVYAPLARAALGRRAARSNP